MSQLKRSYDDSSELSETHTSKRCRVEQSNITNMIIQQLRGEIQLVQIQVMSNANMIVRLQEENRDLKRQISELRIIQSDLGHQHATGNGDYSYIS